MTSKFSTKIRNAHSRIRANFCGLFVIVGFGIILISRSILFSFNNNSNGSLLLFSDDINNVIATEIMTINTNNDSLVSSRSNSMTCSPVQEQIIRKQLSSGNCTINSKMSPWLQRCSLTKATKCVEAKWLYDHYNYDYSKNQPEINDNNDNDMNNTIWIGINVGCNKGFDAINMGRMLSDDVIKFDRNNWRIGMELKNTVLVGCELQSLQYEPLSLSSSSSSFLPNDSNHNYMKSSEVHIFCIEPMPLTVDALQYSASTLNLSTSSMGNIVENEKTTSSFTITKAAVGRDSQNGTLKILFPSAPVNKRGTAEHHKIQVGTENVGLGSESVKNCYNNGNKNSECEEVPIYTLDEYIANYVQTKIKNNNKNNMQHSNSNVKYKILTVDVEGYDFDVLLGGSNTIQHFEYIEIEYNWIGSWSTQKLYDFILYMSTGGNNFICYWAGQNLLWRITGCFLHDYYEFHTWSNIACVNPSRNKHLANRMEDIFLETLQTNVSYS